MNFDNFTIKAQQPAAAGAAAGCVGRPAGAGARTPAGRCAGRGRKCHALPAEQVGRE